MTAPVAPERHERRFGPVELPPHTAAFYSEVMAALEAANVPFLIGGAFAGEVYTDIGGHTKDLDLFLAPGDVRRALTAARRRGFAASVVARHWLAKIGKDADFVDVIFGSGNGIAVVDEGWFAHARPAEVLGFEARLIPVEEMIWSKGYIMERERFDGADVAHLLRVHGRTLDWRRLLDRFGDHWRVLLAHVVLFDFSYPTDRGRIPAWVRRELLDRAAAEAAVEGGGETPNEQEAAGEARLCNGTLLSRAQYLPDIERFGYVDGRIEPHGPLDGDFVRRETKRMRKELAQKS